MLNLKSRKGAIATLLTLGLVVIGTLITLGTSLFVNNQKNIASNPRASSQASCGGIVSGCSKNYYACGGNKYSTTSACSNNDVGDEGPGNYCKRVCGSSGGGGGGTGGVDCGMVLQEAKAECGSSSGDYTKVGCLKIDGEQTYKCSSNIAPTQPSTGGGGGGYPADDSCWIVKCIDGKAKKMTPAYTTSLSQYDMPLSSCPDGSPYSGGGWTVIGSDNADAKAKTFDCQNGNDEVTLVPTKVPTKPPTNTCVKHVGFKCSSGGYTSSTKTFDYYKSTAVGCSSNMVGGSCYGTSANSCSTEWNVFLKSQCSPATGGGTNCTDADYTSLANSYCGANGWCGPKQKKYKKLSTNKCVPTNSANSEFKCKNDSSCSSNQPTSNWLQPQPTSNWLQPQPTSNWLQPQPTSNWGSIQTTQNDFTGTVLWSTEGNCNLLPNGLCAVNDLNSSSNN